LESTLKLLVSGPRSRRGEAVLELQPGGKRDTWRAVESTGDYDLSGAVLAHEGGDFFALVCAGLGAAEREAGGLIGVPSVKFPLIPA
jgi:hypothetical protein